MKKAQLSVILIIGVIIILTTGLFVIHNNQTRKQGLESTAIGSMTFQSDVLRAFMNGCIDEGIDLAKEEIGISENTLYQFQNVMKGSVRSCLLNLVSELEIQGWEFEIGEIESEVEISELNIVVKVTYPITGRKLDDTVHFESVTRNLYRQATASLRNGVAGTDIILATPDEDAAVTITKGTKATVNSEPVDQITVRILDRNEFGLSNPVTVGETMLEIGPEGVVFSKPIAIRFRFSEDQILNDDWRERSRVAWLNPSNNVWYAQPTLINCDHNRCLAESFTMHASTWTVVSGVCKSECKDQKNVFGRLILSPYVSGPEAESSLDYEVGYGFMLNDKYFYGLPYDGTDFDTETFPEKISLPVGDSGDWKCRAFLGDETTEETIVEALECASGNIVNTNIISPPNHIPDRSVFDISTHSYLTFEGVGYEFESVERAEECLTGEDGPMVPVEYFSAKAVKKENPYYKCCKWEECEQEEYQTTDENGQPKIGTREECDDEYGVYGKGEDCPDGDKDNGGTVSGFDSHCGPGWAEAWYWDTEIIGEITQDDVTVISGKLAVNALTYCMNNKPSKLDACIDANIKLDRVGFVEEEFKGFMTQECAGGKVSGVLASVKYTNDGSACLDTDFIRGLDIDDVNEMNLVIESTCGTVASTGQCVRLMNQLGNGEPGDELSGINLAAEGIGCSDNCEVKAGFAERSTEGAANLYADLIEITIDNGPGSVYDDVQDLLSSLKDVKLVIQGNANAAMRICFPAGTKIATPDGDMDIEDIKLGQPVYSYNVSSGKVEIKPVVRTYVRESRDIATVETGSDVIKATPDHPFWNGGEFVAIEEFEVGEQLFKLENGNLNEETIRSITIDESRIPVYNLKVADNFNYFAYGYLNHNNGYDDIVAVEMMAPSEYCQQEICACGTTSGEAKFIERTEKCEVDPMDRFMENEDGSWSYYLCNTQLECEWIDTNNDVGGGQQFAPMVIEMMASNPGLLPIHIAIQNGYDGDPTDLEAYLAWWNEQTEQQRQNMAQQAIYGWTPTNYIQFLLSNDPTINSIEYLAYTNAIENGYLIDEDRMDFLMEDAANCLNDQWPDCSNEWTALIMGTIAVVAGGVIIAPAALELFETASIWAYVNLPLAAGGAGSAAMNAFLNSRAGQWFAQNMQNPLVQNFLNNPWTGRIASLAVSTGLSYLQAQQMIMTGSYDLTGMPGTAMYDYFNAFFGPMMNNMMYGARIETARSAMALLEGGAAIENVDNLADLIYIYGDDAISQLRYSIDDGLNSIDDILMALDDAGLSLDVNGYLRLAGDNYDRLRILLDKGLLKPEQALRGVPLDKMVQWVNEGKFTVDDIANAGIDPELLDGLSPGLLEDLENAYFSKGTSSEVVQNIESFLSDMKTFTGMNVNEVAKNPALFEQYVDDLTRYGYSEAQINDLRDFFNNQLGTGKFKIVLQVDENNVLKIFKTPLRANPETYANPAEMDAYYNQVYNDFKSNPRYNDMVRAGNYPPDVQEAINYFQYQYNDEIVPGINNDMAARGFPGNYLPESEPVIVDGKVVGSNEEMFGIGTLEELMANGYVPPPESVAISIQMYKDSAISAGSGDLVANGALRVDNVMVVPVTEDFLYKTGKNTVLEVSAEKTQVLLIPFDRGGATDIATVTNPNFIQIETEGFENALWNIYNE